MDRTWQYLRDEVSPTVALVQEAFVLPAVGGGAVSPDPAPMRYRTAVIGYAAKVAELPEIRTRYSTSTPFTIKPTLATTLAVAQVFPADVDPLGSGEPVRTNGTALRPDIRARGGSGPHPTL